jgi:GAF domain-containing protein
MSSFYERAARSFKSNMLRYAAFGAIFGLTFPIAATMIKIVFSGIPLTIENFVLIQKADPVLWIVDTVPIVLGIIASLAGRRQDALQRAVEKLSLREKELESIQTTLEERIRERTQELQTASEQAEKRATRLQAITELSETIALIHDPNTLLPVIAQSISEQFGNYHTGIFLLDEERNYAVLRAANSAGGQKMLARQHQLKVGGIGIVGYVAQTGRPRLALDTGEDVIFFNNPDLPETRSEVALPLKVRSQVIGVLDVQSTQPSGFNDEDVETFSTLANQVATAIQNARLLEQTRSALQSIRQSGRQAWLESLEETAAGYSYLPNGMVVPSKSEKREQLQALLASGQILVNTSSSGGQISALAIPVKLRDQVIGIIHVEAGDSDRNWSEDEIAMVQSISERAALSLENARLFEETTRRAERERVISQVTSRISESTNFDRILQTTIQELARTLGTSRTFIQLQSPSSNGGDGSSQETPQV